MNHFPILLKREFWENRGGLLTAPVVTAIVVVTLVVLGWITGHIMAGAPDLNGVPVHMALLALSQAEPEKITFGINIGFHAVAVLLTNVMWFVVFFYCLGALYDDRKDRSILFWKSLPVSDTQTVMSKVAVACLGAPILTFAVTVVLQFALLVVAGLIMAAYGANPWALMWSHAEPWRPWIDQAAAIPVHALWYLPIYGYLLFISSWAKSKPFLWVFIPPLVFSFVQGWISLMTNRALPKFPVWEVIGTRIMDTPLALGMHISNKFNIGVGGAAEQQWRTLSEMGAMMVSWKMWGGVVLGAVFIAGAIHFRRNRELAD